MIKLATTIICIVAMTTVMVGCDALNQDPIDSQHDIYIYNETRQSCPISVFMDLEYALEVPYNCQDCTIEDVEAGTHLLQAYTEDSGELISEVVIELDNHEDWWWWIRYCPEE